MKTKKGAASFYIVAFSTLILVVIAASFATLVINEITRTSNDDLSQSAYDSALAGVEDAKVAFMNYQRCIESGVTTGTKPTGTGTPTCAEIVYWVQHPDCYMVGHILGRIGKTENKEVAIGEVISSDGRATNNLNQAYTCAIIDADLSDYRANITTSNSDKVVKVELQDGIHAKDIEAVKFSWYSNRDGVDYSYSHFDYGSNGGKVVFRPINMSGISTPPAMAIQLIQTGQSFTLEQFEASAGNTTNRGTLYLIPFGDTAAKPNARSLVSKNEDANTTYVYAQDNKIDAKWFALANDKNSDNRPFLVYCNGNSSTEYACTVTINLPQPVGGTARNDDTFMFTVSLPYGQPDTDFSMEFICKNGVSACGNSTSIGEPGSSETKKSASLSNVQVRVDSTGRANDLFRRVETRLETTDTAFAYPFYAIQLLGTGNDKSLLEKNMPNVTTEYNFR